MNVLVYSTGPTCQRCVVVQKHLDRRGIEYTVERIDQDIEQAKALRAQGFNQAPVLKVEVDGEDPQFCEGYRPDFIDGLVTSAA